MTQMLEPRVIDVRDLRGMSPEELGASLLRDDSDRHRIPVGVLVVVSIAGATACSAALGDFLASPLAESTVVIVVGRLGPDGVLRLPVELRGHGAPLVLWAGDSSGTVWAPRSIASTDADSEGGEHSLDRLISVVSSPEIFTRLKSYGGAIVAPGLFLAGGINNTKVIRRALLEALDTLSGSSAAPSTPTLEGESLSELRRRLTPPTTNSVIVAGGQLDVTASEVLSALQDGVALGSRIPSATGVLFGSSHVSNLREAAIRASAGLSSLRTQAVQLRQGIQDPGGWYVEEAVIERAAVYGVRPGPRGNSGRTVLADLTGAVIVDGLASSRSLRDVDETLRDLEAGLRPGSYTMYIDAINDAVPDQLLNSLAEPPHFPAVPMPLLGIAMALGLAGGLVDGHGIFFGSVSALISVVVAASWPAPTARRRSIAGSLTAGAAYAGVLLGLFLGAAGSLPGPATGLLWLGTLCVGVVLLLASWRACCRRWLNSVPLREARAARDATIGAVTAVGEEWTALDTRPAASDLLILARGLVQAAIRRMRVAQDAMPGGPAFTVPVEDNSQEEYWRAVARARVGGLAIAGFESDWATLTMARGQENEPDKAMAEAVEYLTRADPARCVLEGGARGRDVEALEASGAPAELLVNALRLPRESLMWQFTHPDDLGCLSERVDKALVVHFAPAWVSEATKARLPDDCVTTRAPGLAGVLRLNRLREGTIA